MTTGRPKTQPLTPVQSRASKRGLFCTRLTFIVIFLQMACMAWFFNLRVKQLINALNSEETEIEQLHVIIHNQAEVIQRFNNSITNSDVIQQLGSLEKDLHVTEAKMEEELVETQTEVSDSLNETLMRLNRTVASAKKEIYTEVDRVKADLAIYVRTTNDQFSTENTFMVFQLAGTFTLLSCLITMWHMTAHLRRFKEPSVQRKILAILWMTPIYGITSWLSLVLPHSEPYLAVIKDFYEAYVIYQFLSFCIAVLGRGNRDAVVKILEQHAHHLDPPFQLFRLCCPRVYESNHAMADAVLLQCQTFAMQFVFLRPLTTIAIFTCNELHYYGGGTSGSDYRSPQFWITMLQNLSVFIAFSGLLKFYHAVQDELSWCRPFPKFLCIKGIVFMTFWQGLVISVLATTTEAGGTREDVEMWGKQAQNFLICLEMLGFAIAHFYCFPTDEWEQGYRPTSKADRSFGDNLAFGDFLNDLKMIVRQGAVKRSTKKERPKDGRGKDSNTSDETDDDSTPETTTSIHTNSEVVEEADHGLENPEALLLDDDEESMKDEELTRSVLMATQKLLSSQDLSRSSRNFGNMLVGSYSINRMRSYSESDEEHGIQRFTAPLPLDFPVHANVEVDENSEEDKDDDDDGVDETTSLLSKTKVTPYDDISNYNKNNNNNNNNVLLRPSIFTSVGSFEGEPIRSNMAKSISFEDEENGHRATGRSPVRTPVDDDDDDNDDYEEETRTSRSKAIKIRRKNPLTPSPTPTSLNSESNDTPIAANPPVVNAFQVNNEQTESESQHEDVDKLGNVNTENTMTVACIGESSEVVDMSESVSHGSPPVHESYMPVPKEVSSPKLDGSTEVGDISGGISPSLEANGDATSIQLADSVNGTLPAQVRIRQTIEGDEVLESFDPHGSDSRSQN